MVPASMFMYGSILIEVTLRPVVLSKRPVDEAALHNPNDQLAARFEELYETRTNNSLSNTAISDSWKKKSEPE
jgi:hypothetical protein